MFKWVLILVFFVLRSFTTSGQTLSYIISFKDDDIGILTVKRTLSGNKATYHIESNIHVEKIMTIDITYHMDAEFENGQLIHSTVKQISNGRLQISSETKWDGSRYFVKTLEGSRRLREKKISYNLAMLYFTEPKNAKEIWSDSFCRFLSITITRKHSYKLLTPDGKASFFTFNYGICSMVETEQLFSKVKFRLRD